MAALAPEEPGQKLPQEPGQKLPQEQPEAPAADELGSRAGEPASAELAEAEGPAQPVQPDASMEAPAADELGSNMAEPAPAELAEAERPAQPVQPDASMEASGQAEAEAPAQRREVKRPKPAFWLFQEEMRSQVAAELGAGVVASKAASVMAARWKELDEGAKAKYVEKARELKAQYDKDIADGAVQAVSAKKMKAAKAAAKKATGVTKRQATRHRTLQNLKRRAAPKKPSGSYSLWLAEHRKGVRARLVADGQADPSFEDIAKAAGKAWLALSDEQKAPYVERSRALNAKFKDISKACNEYVKASAKDTKGRAKKAKVAGAKIKTKRAVGKAAKEVAGKAKKPAAEKALKPKPEKALKQKPEPASKKEVATPQKRKGGDAGPTPKKAKKAPAEVKEAYMDMALVAEAEKAGFAGAFRKLAEREDMRPFPQRKLLDALAASGGLLHPAKDALLAGTA